MTTTHAALAADALHGEVSLRFAGLTAAVKQAIHAQHAHREAVDLVDCMQSAVAAIAALETVEAAAKEGAAGMRAALAATMSETGCTALETDGQSASLRDAAQLAVINDPKALPLEYLKARDPEPDRPAIRKALLAGQPVPGAALSNGGAPILTIRSKP